VNQKVALGLLRRLGVEADLAASGREGVEAAARVRYDLVLMDVQMPDMDGFETTAAIRACEGAGPRVPIVAMTARAMKGDRERCLAAGMDDYLTKPVRGEDLDRALDRWGPRAGSGEGTAEGGAEGEPESGVRSPAADPGSPDPVARGPRAQ